MEQRLLIKYLREQGHGSTKIYSKLAEHDEDKALSHFDVSYWVGQFRPGQESVEDSICN
jgi:hypothetical protein